MRGCAHRAEIEELAMGALPPDGAARARAHTLSCPSCAEELAHLLQERALFARRAAAVALPPPRFAQVLATLERQRSAARSIWQRAVQRAAMGGALVAAAAAVVLAVRASSVRALVDADESLQSSSASPATPPAESVHPSRLGLEPEPAVCSQTPLGVSEQAACVQPALASNEPATCTVPSRQATFAAPAWIEELLVQTCVSEPEATR